MWKGSVLPELAVEVMISEPEWFLQLSASICSFSQGLALKPFNLRSSRLSLPSYRHVPPHLPGLAVLIVRLRVGSSWMS